MSFEALPHWAPAYSDLAPEALDFLSASFELAHADRKGGLSIEIGTRRGGSALVLCRLIDRLYPDAPPMLHTVDPYGGRPYRGGDSHIPSDNLRAPYGDSDYVTMKRLLADFPFHAHYYMTDIAYYRFADAGGTYWRGRTQHTIGSIAFMHADGEHDLSAVDLTLAFFARAARTGSVLVVDNCDKSSAVLSRLAALEASLGPPLAYGDRQARLIWTEATPFQGFLP